jgi:hypothetical protein
VGDRFVLFLFMFTSLGFMYEMFTYLLREGIGIGRSWERKSEEKIDTQQRKRI